MAEPLMVSRPNSVTSSGRFCSELQMNMTDIAATCEHDRLSTKHRARWQLFRRRFDNITVPANTTVEVRAQELSTVEGQC